MKIVFFGTPEYVVPVLDCLHKSFKSKLGTSPIAAVVTQAPKPAGRKKELTYSPVDTWAHQRSIPKYFDPQDVVKNKIMADLGVIASYGAIIPLEVISHFPYGILNIHPSLLPKWRGSSPVQATIITEDAAGATIIKIDEKLDHGQIVSQFRDEVLPDDTTESLRRRLFERSAEVLKTLIPVYITGKIKPREQDHEKATFTREIKKDDAFIPPKYLKATLQGLPLKGKWGIPFIKEFTIKPTPEVLNNFIRAMQPWPGAWTIVNIGQDVKDKGQRRLKILNSHLSQPTPHNQQLVIDKVQLEGKDLITWIQFTQGYPKSKFE